MNDVSQGGHFASHESFEVGGHVYQVGRLNAKQQFEVARRLAYPLMMLGAEKQPQFEASDKNFARIILIGSSQIAQADIDAALNICLGVIKRKIKGEMGWVAISTPAGALMFDDIDMSEMLQLVWRVLDAHRLADFLSVNDRSFNER